MTSKNKSRYLHILIQNITSSVHRFSLELKDFFLSNSFENLTANVCVKLTNGSIHLLCLFSRGS